MIEASEEVPYLCFVLKLETPVIRELLGREEIPSPEALSDSPAMSTGETTAELLDACCRLLDLLHTPRDIPFLSGLIQREIIHRILRGPEGARLRAIATLGDQSHRTAKAIAWVRANYAKPLRVEDLAQIAAIAVGYESASQFNREYSRFFGQPPRRDIRTLRAPNAPRLESVGGA